MRKQPTSIDVARLAGVSQTTVSFVLNNRSDKVISPETRARVLHAASELRYRSNKLSNGILRGKTKLIGVVIPFPGSFYFGSLLSSISESAHSDGYQVLLATSSNEGINENEIDSVTRFIEYRVDGIICVANDWSTDQRLAWLDEVLSKRIPLVIVDDRTNAARADCIVTDDFVGARMAVNHLLQKGHRRIAHFAGSEKMSTGRDRLAGYFSALSDAGIKPDQSLVFCRSYDVSVASLAAEELLATGNRPSAVFAAADGIAAPIIGHMVERGMRCPKDLAIIGYSDDDFADSLNLTSIAQFPHEIGKRAWDQILKRIDHRDSEPELITLPVSLVERGSTE